MSERATVERVTTERQPRRVASNRYQRIAIEWLLVVLFAGIVLAILGVAAAIVWWAWS